MLLAMLIFPVLFLILGTLEIFVFSKQINVRFGYRTARSKRNMRNWKLAQILYGKILIFESLIAIIIGILISTFEYPLFSYSIINMYGIVCILTFIASGILVENELKKLDN